MADTTPGPVGDARFPLQVSNDFSRIIFTADDTLWATDGNRSTTTQLPIRRPTAIHWANSSRLFVFGSDLDFLNGGIWVTDFTIEGTRLLLAGDDLSTDIVEQNMLTSGRLGVTFIPRRTRGRNTADVWVASENDNALELLLSPEDGFDEIEPSGVWDLGDVTLLRTISRPSSSSGLVEFRTFHTDGTRSGTTEIQFEPPLNGTVLETEDGFLYSSFDESIGAFRLWRTDGTPGNAELVLPIVRGSLVATDDDLFGIEFGFTGPERFTRFWHLDVEAGTSTQIATLPSDRVLIRPAATWLLVLMADPDTLRFESVGALRPSGYTELVTGLEGFTARQGTVDGDTVHFGIETSAHGYEPWISDGTPGGTKVYDVCAGTCSSDLLPMFPTNRRLGGRSLYFGLASSPVNSAPPPSATTQFFLFDDLGDQSVEQVSDFPADQGPAFTQVIGLRDHLVYFRSDDEHGLEPRAIDTPSTCTSSPTTLCLGNNRFRVDVTWTDFQGGTGDGRSVPLTEDTGSFWFFDPDNLELVVKVIDGTAINGNHWVFYGALSDVAYELRVTDTETGRMATYSNPAGTFGSQGDIDALPGLGGKASVLESLAESPIAAATALPTTDTCTTTSTTLCLADRFEVSVDWTDFEGGTGTGRTLPLTADTGSFWFFDSENIELVLKVIDGTALNGRFWVFSGALSNVAFEITVTDTETGAVKTYSNPSGTFASNGDTQAF